MDQESIKAINVAHCGGKNVFSRSLVGKNETIGGFHFMELYQTAHCIYFCRCETISMILSINAQFSILP